MGQHKSSQSRDERNPDFSQNEWYAVFVLVTLMVMAVLNSAEADCHSDYTDRESCNSADGCVWCLCSALPSSCFSEEDAKRLPSAVFDCNTKSANPMLMAMIKGFGRNQQP